VFITNATTNAALSVASGGAKFRYLAAGTVSPSTSYALYAGGGDVFLNGNTGIGVAPWTTSKVRVLINHSGTGTKYATFSAATLSGSTSNATVVGFGLVGNWSLATNTSNHSVRGADINVNCNNTGLTVTGGAFTGGRFNLNAGSDNTTFGPLVKMYAGNFRIGYGIPTNDSSVDTAYAGFFESDIGNTNNVVTNLINCGSKPPVGSVTGGTVTNYYGFRALSHDDNVNDPVQTNAYAFYADDQTNETLTIADVFHIEPQVSASQGATMGNIRFEAIGGGGNWNTGHIQLGNDHIWSDGSTIYGKIGAPTGATDGTDLMGGGAGGDSFLEWAGL
jgi:hypothetical protein